MLKVPLFCALIALTGTTLVGCREGFPSQSEFVLGTVCAVNLYEQGRNEVYHEIFDRLREIEGRMSVTLPGTELGNINANAGIEPVAVHPDVFEVIELAVLYAELSGGAFDPTVGPLVSLWGIGGDHPRLPSQEEIEAVLPLVNWRDIELDRERLTVFLKKPGMALDLGAIAKGYAADEAWRILKKNRIQRALIDLGGNILVYGEKRDGSPWRVGIQDPLDSRGAYIGIVEIRDQTVVTSGVYERFFETGGTRYHHILSPDYGYPVRNGLLSVSIVTSRSVDADALSTSAFVLGYERGKALVESLEGVGAVFVFEDKSIRLSGETGFILSDESYRILSD
ncbi:MAG: FAD:protein FMN transferase [Spirochaetaceae bacterium]|jgi:thiamine biosynthesis lipoprotein|nr:FAD:protein FMN transferase [Spirochaetaceae bacterium]